MYGETFRNWGHSHNLPKGRFPILIAEKANISPRCQDENNREGCHEALDRCDFSRISGFRDLGSIMAYRRENAPEEYNKFVTGLKAEGCHDYEYEEI